jgi:DeoR family transcriptional regulator, catabolite repression regulator
MALNERQLRILRVIDAGHTTGEAIVEALGSSLQMLSYYVNQMVDDGYIKAAKVYDNDLKDFVVVRAYLTPEGKSILEANPQPASPAAASPGTSLGTSQVSETTVATAPNPDASIDYAMVGEAIAKLGEIIATLPGDWRELAEVYLDDLQAEINIAYRRRPIRIRAYFLAILRTLLPIVTKTPQGDDLIQQARSLSQLLNIPVKLPGD